MITRASAIAGFIVCLACGVPVSAAFETVDVDEFLGEGLTFTQLSSLSASISMMLDGSTLHVNVENTTPGDLMNSSNVLTGLAFTLPSGVTITPADGSVTFAMGATFFGWSPDPMSALFKDPDETWGYNNPPIDSGHFDAPSAGGDGPAQLVYTHVVGTINSDADMNGSNRTTFAGAFKMKGPNFGLLSTQNTSTSVGFETTRGVMELHLSLSGLSGFTSSQLIAFINNGPVGVAFGSPDASSLNPPPPFTEVPEPSSLALLLMGSVVCLRTRRRQPHRCTAA